MTLRTRAADAAGYLIATAYIAALEGAHRVADLADRIPTRWARVTHQPTPEEEHHA